MERLSQSRGNSLVLKAYGSTRFAKGSHPDILSLVRVYYPEYFQVKEEKIVTKEEKETFIKIPPRNRGGIRNW